jgi:SlyX protein
MEERMEKVETDLAYLQETVRQLNDIVTEQQVVVTKLEKQVEFLAKRVEELDTEARPNRKPPHY